MSMKIKTENLYKHFEKGDSTVDVLKGINFDIEAGETAVSPASISKLMPLRTSTVLSPFSKCLYRFSVLIFILI